MSLLGNPFHLANHVLSIEPWQGERELNKMITLFLDLWDIAFLATDGLTNKDSGRLVWQIAQNREADIWERSPAIQNPQI